MANNERSQQQKHIDAAAHHHHQSQPRTTAPTPPATLQSQEVATRAYGLYEQGGRQDGHDMAHWLQAESQLSREHHAAPGRAVPA